MNILYGDVFSEERSENRCKELFSTLGCCMNIYGGYLWSICIYWHGIHLLYIYTFDNIIFTYIYLCSWVSYISALLGFNYVNTTIQHHIAQCSSRCLLEFIYLSYSGDLSHLTAMLHNGRSLVHLSCLDMWLILFLLYTYVSIIVLHLILFVHSYFVWCIVNTLVVELYI